MDPAAHARIHIHTRTWAHRLSGQVAQTLVFLGEECNRDQKCPEARRGPEQGRGGALLRPCRLPPFTRRLNEAAGAAEMNQSPAWAWEGRRTGRPAWRVRGDPQDGAGQGRGGVAMPPGGNGAAVLLSCRARSCPPPHPFSTSGRAMTVSEATLRGKPRRGQAGGCTGHLGAQALSWNPW